MDDTARPPHPGPLPEGEGVIRPRGRWVAALLLAVFAAIFVQSAWVADDAMITFRSVEQLFAGNGPRWNPHERVQAFTHPLWFLLLAAARLFARDLILGVTALSFAATVAALWVAGREVRGALPWGLGLLALASSRALVDFTSSGLETALVYLLLALLLRPRAGLLGVWLTVSALLLCRLDLAPLVLPLALSRSAGPGPRLRPIALGLAPLAAWTAFSLAYYGFALPNTAYAKLATGIPASESIAQGVRYLVHAARWDPITLLLIAAGCVVATRALRLAIALQLAYVVWIGGDFMAGRFLAPIAWVALLSLVAALPRLARREAMLAALALALYNFAAPAPPLRPLPAGGPAWSYQDWWGIADERGHYFSRYGLLPYLNNGRRVVDPRAQQGVIDPRLGIRFSIGWGGWTAPLDRILVDPLGLADPLLARLPCRPGWRVGHYVRGIPDGYLESLESGENRIADPALHAVYDDLLLATRGELWTAARWRAIARLNLRPRPSSPPLEAQHRGKKLPLPLAGEGTQGTVLPLVRVSS